MRASAVLAIDEAIDRSNVIHVIQGESHVSADPSAMMTTILGSCVAACLFDQRAGVGGMNHFLLPGEEGGGDEDLRFGVNAMELLINGLLRLGARRDNLRAKLFGGARMVAGLSDIGAKNAAFANRFLEREGLPCVGGSLGGDHARRIQFWPVTGRARQIYPTTAPRQVFESELREKAAKAAKPVADSGDLELF
jgi:chemotaxis protein CheD